MRIAEIGESSKFRTQFALSVLLRARSFERCPLFFFLLFIYLFNKKTLDIHCIFCYSFFKIIKKHYPEYNIYKYFIYLYNNIYIYFFSSEENLFLSYKNSKKIIIYINYYIIKLFFLEQPRIERHHPLNLSILLSGGRETNRDSLSSGERTGKSSSFKSE